MGVPLLAAGLIGGAVSAFGSYESGQAQSQAAAYQSQVAANNATIAQQNARVDIQAGETAATNKGLETRAKVGAQRAGQGAAGVDPNSGSASQVQAGTKQIGMLDALTLRSNAAKQAYGQQVAATSDTAQSQLDTAESSQAAEAGDIGATGTLLSSVSTAGGNYARWQSQFGSTPSPGNFVSDSAIY